MPARKKKKSTGVKKKSGGVKKEARIEADRKPTRSVGPKRATPAAARRSAPPPTFWLTTPESGRHAFHVDGPLKEIAMRWGYVLRQRVRWVGARARRRELAEEARASLHQLGLDDDLLERIAKGGIVEVGTRYLREEEGWAARVMPWEFVLSTATRPFRSDASFTVVRHLERPGPAPAGEPRSLALAKFAPGSLEDAYSFDTEIQLVTGGLEQSPDDVPLIDSPTPERLASELHRLRPGVIHVMGIDVHEGAQLLASRVEPQRDGVFVPARRGVEPLDALDLARALNAGGGVRLVAFNLPNSAPRMAALAVAEGAGAALGIQDQVDDEIAELFFGAFYRSWRKCDWDVLEGFRGGWQELSEPDIGLHGTGIVLWSATPLIEAKARPLEPLPRQAASRPPDLRADAARPLRDLLHVDPRPNPRLNYALLHNGGSVFSKLTLSLSEPGVLRDVDVAITLHVGDAAFPYRRRLDVTRQVLDIAANVRLPLTWEFVRGMSEATRTTLHVKVSKEEDVVYEDSHAVTLLPVDEWRDTDRDGLWLPSFVLPRDPTVARIVDRAQGYLQTLQDDARAGFSGYQENTAGIERQVRALWAALVYDHQLAYINPPPTYSESSQRLRTPSQVIDGGRGTCIDLALLFAAVLEYVEIYPAMFLLEGHAMPGYWVSEQAHESLATPRFEGTAETAAGSGAGPADGQGFLLRGENAYDEILYYVEQKVLVPLESTLLTSAGSFRKAVQQGRKALSVREEFDAYLDVMRARWDADVTPLPLQERGGVGR